MTRTRFLTWFAIAIFCSLVVGLGASAVVARAAPADERGNPWDAIALVKEQVADLFETVTPLTIQLSELTERVDALSQEGSGQQGAGDVAFIFWDPDGVHVLKRDGTVWKCPSCGWLPDNEPYDLTPPVPVADIVEWKLFAFLDKNGDVWRFNESFGWQNYGHP